jgi:hypothetical protein
MRVAKYAALAVAATLFLIVAIALGASCAAPQPPQPKAPDGAPPGSCVPAPTHVYYGSCSDKLAAGGLSCALCDGARGCSYAPGIYCVGALACDDPACSKASGQ